ncbi:hypothetical protein M8C21_010307, partial [Ambrosia artemisiifolia]
MFIWSGGLFGPVELVQIPADPVSGHRKGFGLIQLKFISKVLTVCCFVLVGIDGLDVMKLIYRIRIAGMNHKTKKDVKDKIQGVESNLRSQLVLFICKIQGVESNLWSQLLCVCSASLVRAMSFTSPVYFGCLKAPLTRSDHQFKSGPVTAEAMFINREEIPVYPIYRDPVHDFGFFRYDPAAVKFLSCEEIPLAPEDASVGLDIRVVGNDSGEK